MDPIKLENAKNNITESRKGIRYKHETIAPGIHVYSDVWADGFNFVKQLDDAGKFIREDYLIDSKGNEIPKEVGKRGVSTWVKGDNPAGDKILCDVFDDIIDSYLWHYDLDPRSREWWRISKYTEGDYFGMHPDDSYGTPRTVAMVYYPNDDYEGGELEFIHFGVKVKPKANQLFVFPAAYIYEHKISDIGPGNPRYTIVAFFCNINESDRVKRIQSLPQPYKTSLRYISEIKNTQQER